MFLSIIVPVYNVELYLKKCVESLLNQDIPLSEYEIILVDDGSTDSSGHICDSFVEKHGNIRVIHRQNGGLSAARNTGIAAARGKYIQLIDSDDYLNPNVLRGILCQIEKQDLDILRINYQNVNAAGVIFDPNKYSKPFVDYSEEVCDGFSFLDERLGYACYAVQFIVRASLLQQERYLFREGILFEDVEWTPRIILIADRIASNPCVVYNYLYRDESITRTSDLEKKRKKIDNQFLLIDALSLQANEFRNVKWFEGMISQISLAILYSVSRFFPEKRKFYIDVLKKKRVFPLSTYHATVSQIRKMRVINISPALGCWFFYFINRFIVR